MQTPTDSTYFTDHLYLAAYLTCSGHGILRTSRQSSRVAFEFAATPELHADVAGFMSGAAIPARQFCFELLKLKRLIPRQTVKKGYRIATEEIPR